MNNNNPTYPASTTLLISVCFFLSGLAGLIYEVVWARQLGLFLGITSYAHTAVITAYMAGLAAGSLYFGRYADRHSQSLKMYAWLEIGVGVYAAMTPWLFKFLQLGYAATADVSQVGEVSGYMGRFSIALLALLIPTFLMGGTLPLLVRGFVNELPGLGKVTGRFYGINTLGAMSGTLAAGYLLLPLLGIKATIFTAVLINLGVAFIVLGMLHSLRPSQVTQKVTPVAERQKQESKRHSITSGSRYVVLVGFGLAGFASLLTQMAWIRAFILVVGGSVYAFTITLASFLAGIGLGSLFYIRYMASPGVAWARFCPDGRMAQAALLALLISLTLLLGLPLIGQLPAWFLAGYAAGLKDSFFLFQLFIFFLSFSLMILPTLFMGALFPLVTVIWTRSIDQTGRGVGAAYAINATGTILGALLGGLFILPWLGVQHSIELAAGFYFLVASGFWLFSAGGLNRPRQYAVTIVAALVLLSTAWLIPPWNKTMMVSGVFSRPDGMKIAVDKQPDNNLQKVIDEYELLYYKEGTDATVAVRKKKDSAGSQRTLVINGKADASSSGDMPTQVLLAQLPLALNRQAENALVIGLGSGITAGSLSTNKALKNITILEISDEVVEASTFFEPENYQVLSDPRVKLVTADARNYLLASAERYDLIISEPSNPWISGIANLFTDEFLKLAKSRLSENGAMTQWFHTYGMSDSDLKTMLKTFDDNFRHVSVWRIQEGDLALIGSDKPHAMSLAYALQSGAKEFSRARVNDERDLIGLYIFGGGALSRYVSGSKSNSDNTPVVEFNAPKYLYSLTKKSNMDNIFNYLQGGKQAVPMTDMVDQHDTHLDARFMRLRVANSVTTAARISAQWMIDRPMVQLNMTSVAGLGSERLLTWMEGPARYQIRAVYLSADTSSDSLQELLDQLMSRTGRQGGTVKMTDGRDAIWLSNGAGNQTSLQLDIAWDCPAQDSGFIRYALNTSIPDPGLQGRAAALSDLVARFTCY